ncbi:hypothetical protein CSH63_17845 [Micromonospora tulbaghiae]|uniref:Uncharacterized protein n=1 Tax=Micromonospora tulbaghiae TaxID=479978 RepID=A0A386WRX0_9ACTN|nr:hypothetical protein [Micromonospora tulbaghiae]AYF29294.1 hypothetical protein CSH63_17845 [Micromonospora tulbaghiae]
MARIRSIKPEFWKSEAIACHDFFTRLVFIGLWSYVDDNGVGIDNYRLIAAELFPLEEDFARVSRELRESLARLSDAGRILRYTVEGKSYLAVVNWSEHQRIDKPNKARYPGPDDSRATPTPPDKPPTRENTEPSRNPRETLAQPSRDPRATPSTGAVEQGNRGAGEQGIVPPTAVAARPPTAGRTAPPAPRPLALVEPTPPDTPPATTQTLVAEWIDGCRKRPPRDVIGQVSRHIKTMLAENTDPADVRRGLAAWARKGLHPSTLPSVVNEVMNSGNAHPDRKPSTADQRFGEAMALAARFAKEEAS